MIEIPLRQSPEQLFTITINASIYSMRVLLNSRTEQWSLSIATNNVPLAEGVIMAAGVNLLSALNIGLNNMYIVNVNNTNLDPLKTELGIVSKLVLVTDEELENATAV